ncbi:MAG: DEAD/DEAH box helicase family protein [Pirellulales bacterium]|nr:DEAD/DEAH box helicase family protein [Pirellulales bacterium]
MALHPNFPTDPHVVLDPAIRWFPADEAYRDTRMDHLLPPLVSELRMQVKSWRDSRYVGATDTSRCLLDWWFAAPHLLHFGKESIDNALEVEFEYYFAQREAIETLIYLVDIVGAQDKFDMLRFDRSGAASASMFDENWRRFVFKLATGAGKTKVLSLALAWSYFHKLYEPESTLARNFLVIAPNIIVLDRIYRDFHALRIFFSDPVLPYNGFEGRNWRDDFQLTLHKQDDVRVTRPTGNIFLTNIHRVYSGNDTPPSADDDNSMDYFLGKRPTGGTTESKVDLGAIVRDIDELAILNDEAHHIHDNRLAWFKSIDDIHNRLVQKGGALAFQVDVTATPKHNNGAIFIQTVADYPLVEAIWQNVVKHPVLPDAASRSKLHERQSIRFVEKYADYLDLGVLEWRKSYEVHAKAGKKAILFVMTDDTKNCDEVAAYLESNFSDLEGAVLTIHTKNNGEISEASSGKAQEELESLREKANNIDSFDSPFKAIVSVLMLKEGWDVRNVTTIVGLRAYAAKSNILPEQTLGRGLRKMYPGSTEEYVSVVGTDAFMDFVESIQAEGVILDLKPMGKGTGPIAPLVVEVDKENENKDLDQLDIEIPIMTPRVYREYKNLSHIEVDKVERANVPYREFTAEEQREIVFKDITTGEVMHTTILDSAGDADWRSVIGYFARQTMKDLKLISGYDAIYGKIKAYVQDGLFDREVTLEHPNTLRNLSELPATKALLETFKKAVNALTVHDRGDAEIRDRIKLRDTRPFVAKDQGYVVPKKSVFNRIIGDSGFELKFAAWLDNCPDVISYGKNYLAVPFRLDYVKATGDISTYHPDFFVKVSDKQIYLVETKGQVDEDVEPKMNRLSQWCADINTAQSDVRFDFVYVDEEGFDKYSPKSFLQLAEAFRKHKDSQTRGSA